MIAKLKRLGFDPSNPTRFKKLLIALGVILVLVAALVTHLAGDGDVEEPPAVTRAETIEAPRENEPEVVRPPETTSSPAIYVDVSGAVNKPMVIELPAGSRVFDAIEAAGGPTERADTRHINRATPLNDGDRVYIPTEDEVADGVGVPSSAGADGGAAPAASDGGKININTADAETLQQLTGVGPATAEKILDYRAQNGNFKTTEELQNVSGIGPKTFEKMREKITV
jgi:competence protein ComEA